LSNPTFHFVDLFLLQLAISVIRAVIVCAQAFISEKSCVAPSSLMKCAEWIHGLLDHARTVSPSFKLSFLLSPPLPRLTGPWLFLVRYRRIRYPFAQTTS